MRQKADKHKYILIKNIQSGMLNEGDREQRRRESTGLHAFTKF